MSRRNILLAAAALGVASCGGSALEVRSISRPIAEGRKPANFRLAEGNAQLALGNVGLALESYRKALREEPASVEAMVGLATCYDRMGRADLSRRHYEMALAAAPRDLDLYGAFAESLDGHGQRTEAARVRSELAARVVAPEAPREVPGSVPVLPPPPAPSVKAALAPTRSAPVAVAVPVTGARLERLSMGEVALVTRATSPWKAATVSRSARSTTIRFDKQPEANVTLLNAARVRGLAARTRTYLAGRGFAAAQIGDAPAVQQHSAILFGAADRGRAERLAAQFGFDLQRRPEGKRGVIILLGRDAARDAHLARPSA